MPTGNAAKVIKGSEHDTEYDNIATMSATKANKLATATNTRIATVDGNGDLQDGGNATLTGGNMAVSGTLGVTGVLTGSGGVVTDTVTAETTNGNLALAGNGTGIVTTDSLSATTTNGNLALTGNGTGEVSIDGNTVGNATGEIPLSNGTKNVNLNAQFLNGLKIQKGTYTSASISGSGSTFDDIALSEVTTVYGVAVMIDPATSSPYSFNVMALDENGFGVMCNATGAAPGATPSTPAAGNLRLQIYNSTGTAQTVDVRYVIYGV